VGNRIQCVVYQNGEKDTIHVLATIKMPHCSGGEGTRRFGSPSNLPARRQRG